MLDQKLEQLLRTKKYQALNREELDFVSKSLTAKEYEQFRLVLCGSKNSLQKYATAPSPMVKHNLMAAMRAKNKAKRPLHVGWNKFANHRIPAWQAAAAIALLMFCTLLLKQQVVFIENSPAEPLMVYKTDTVFETVYKTDTVFEEVPVYLNGKKNVNVKPGGEKSHLQRINNNQGYFGTNTQAIESEANRRLGDADQNRLLADSMPIFQHQSNPAKNSWLDIPARGRTAKDDQDLLQFLTEIN